MPQQIRFYINLPAARYQAFYQGVARSVVVTAHDGRRLKFPANILRPYLTHEGVHGEFQLEYDDNNRFSAIRRLGDLPR